LSSKPDNSFKNLVELRDYVVQTDIVDAEALVGEYSSQIFTLIETVLNGKKKNEYSINYNIPNRAMC
jgi:hypothetical protein